MSWDIYGNKLRSGFCEVHPYVAESYPCSVCYNEAHQDKAQKDREKEMIRQIEKEWYVAIEKEQQEQQGFEDQLAQLAEQIKAKGGKL